VVHKSMPEQNEQDEPRPTEQKGADQPTYSAILKRPESDDQKEADQPTYSAILKRPEPDGQEQNDEPKQPEQRTSQTGRCKDCQFHLDRGSNKYETCDFAQRQPGELCNFCHTRYQNGTKRSSLACRPCRIPTPEEQDDSPKQPEQRTSQTGISEACRYFTRGSKKYEACDFAQRQPGEMCNFCHERYLEGGVKK
jgi:hypothetical protein